MCPHVLTAIITHGDSIWKHLPICAAPDCPVHRPKYTIAPAPDFEQRQQEAQQQREERQQQRDKREKALRALVLRFPSTATEQRMRFLLKALVTGDLENSFERLQHGWMTTKPSTWPQMTYVPTSSTPLCLLP